MSKIGDLLKMIAVKMAIPVLLEEGKTNLHEVLLKLSKEQPNRFAIAIQSLYPVVKGVIQPLVHYTKTEFDDEAGDDAAKLLEDLMTELNIDIPTVAVLDFNAPDEPTVTGEPTVTA